MTALLIRPTAAWFARFIFFLACARKNQRTHPIKSLFCPLLSFS
nr:MAG TPA: hypothetical protein [Caudoviricetes sp.]